MSDLEKYYNESFKVAGDPAFSEIEQEYRDMIERTMGFAAWKARRALDAFGDAVRVAYRMN